MIVQIGNLKAKVEVKSGEYIVTSYKVSIAGVVFNQNDFDLYSVASRKLFKKIEAKASKKGKRDRN